MADYVLSCSSTVDLTADYMKRRGIPFAQFHYEIDGVVHADDMGVAISMSEFYKAMADGAMTRTTQINSSEYMDFFESYLRTGKDLLHVTLSSGISGTYNSANIAAEELRLKYPDRKIYIVDSLAASSGYGLLIDKMADLKDEGMGIDELYAWVFEHRLEVNHWFFTSDLTYFIRGGRVSKTAGFVGNVLNICPLLNVSDKGELIPRMKVRPKKKVILETFNKMKLLAADGEDYSGKCFISHAACYEDAKALATFIENYFKKLDGPVQIYDIGTTIGAHTGPGTVALFFWGRKRVD